MRDPVSVLPLFWLCAGPRINWEDISTEPNKDIGISTEPDKDIPFRPQIKTFFFITVTKEARTQFLPLSTLEGAHSLIQPPRSSDILH